MKWAGRANLLIVALNHIVRKRPGRSYGSVPQTCLKAFTSATPFLPIRRGDLIKTATWDSELPLLRVVNVEHFITESTRGIDPSGTIVHRIVLYTESVTDTLEARSKSSWGAPPSRS
jgi:hypothetical protein